MFWFCFVFFLIMDFQVDHVISWLLFLFRNKAWFSIKSVGDPIIHRFVAMKESQNQNDFFYLFLLFFLLDFMWHDFKQQTQYTLLNFWFLFSFPFAVFLALCWFSVFNLNDINCCNYFVQKNKWEIKLNYLQFSGGF